MDTKTPLELSIDIFFEKNEFITLTKTVYTGFIPQHGMEIMDTEIFFKVRTTAMAGLQTLKHTGLPLRRGKFIEGSRKVTSKLFPKDRGLLKESIDFFTKQGWNLDR
jgi:hypothetical protein